MSKNIYKQIILKSLMQIYFLKIKCKKIMIQNSEIRFKIFIKQLNQVFKIMDKKFKGYLLSKAFEKGKVKNNIILSYKEYSKKILDKIETECQQYNKEIDDYVIKIDLDENFDPYKKGKNFVYNIKQSL